jgi:isoleucyl-tRNA synthetase
MTADAALALGTLRHVLMELSKVMAPAMPFFAEQLFLGVKAEDDAESVHLTNWPEAGEIDEQTLVDMIIVRNIVSAALEARTKAGMKVRQPLGSLTVKGNLPDEAYQQLILEEVNVKKLITDTSIDDEVVLDTVITPELKMEGDVREFMRAVQGMRKDAGLQHDDRVVLTIQASDGGQEMVGKFKEDIRKTVGATEIIFGDAEGVEVLAGEHSLTVGIEKV